MTNALVPLLEASDAGYRIVSDLRRLTSFTPSVGAVAQPGLMRVRHKIRSAVIVGGSHLARAISRSTCVVLGIPCTFTDGLPS